MRIKHNETLKVSSTEGLSETRVQLHCHFVFFILLICEQTLKEQQLQHSQHLVFKRSLQYNDWIFSKHNKHLLGCALWRISGCREIQQRTKM